MPLAELRAYQGRNPKPADFDAYWDRALRELDATDPALELKPHPGPATFAECFDLWFTGVGGARIHAQYVRPKAPRERHPAVLKFQAIRATQVTGSTSWPGRRRAWRSPPWTCAARAAFPRTPAA